MLCVEVPVWAVPVRTTCACILINAPPSISNTHIIHRTAQGKEHVDILPQDGADTSGANKTRITTRFLTKYERARILGTRALQIRYVRGAGLGFGWLRIRVMGCMTGRF